MQRSEIEKRETLNHFDIANSLEMKNKYKIGNEI